MAAARTTVQFVGAAPSIQPPSSGAIGAVPLDPHNRCAPHPPQCQWVPRGPQPTNAYSHAACSER
eukprot:3893168-Prymnesium_polylepis.1